MKKVFISVLTIGACCLPFKGAANDLTADSTVNLLCLSKALVMHNYAVQAPGMMYSSRDYNYIRAIYLNDAEKEIYAVVDSDKFRASEVDKVRVYDYYTYKQLAAMDPNDVEDLEKEAVEINKQKLAAYSLGDAQKSLLGRVGELDKNPKTGSFIFGVDPGGKDGITAVRKTAKNCADIFVYEP